MLFHSGIGTVIRSILQEWHDHGCGPKPDVFVPGAAGLSWAAGHLPDFPSYQADSPIYSLREQAAVPWQTRKSKLLWSPHFNVPLAALSRVVVTVHDLLHLAHPELFPGALKQLYARGMLNGAVKKARRIITVSDFSATELVRYTGVDRSRVSVVHNGVGSRWFETVRETPPRSRPYFLFVGNVKPHKNLGRLIKAFAAISEVLKDHDLVIVGKKDGFITTDREAERVATTVGGRIVFTGFLDDAVLAQYVAHAEALVYPSLYEGFGLPPLEAMAAGCPVVSSDIPALRESCGNAAVFCAPLSIKSIADALVAITECSSEERTALIEAGRARARQFTWQKTAAHTLAILNEAAA
jgi:glycosyltransferase involved in cell wall biosynthesis